MRNLSTNNFITAFTLVTTQFNCASFAQDHNAERVIFFQQRAFTVTVLRLCKLLMLKIPGCRAREPSRRSAFTSEARTLRIRGYPKYIKKRSCVYSSSVILPKLSITSSPFLSTAFIALLSKSSIGVMPLQASKRLFMAMFCIINLVVLSIKCQKCGQDRWWCSTLCEIQCLRAYMYIHLHKYDQ